MDNSFDFFASLTLTQSDIRKIVNHLVQEDYSLVDYLGHILITPLYSSKESLGLVQALQSTGAKVMFDSGGYYVQTGKLQYHELYYPLLSYYQQNQWADIYTLPDHVPTSQDDADSVWQKVEDTVQFSTLFFQELPPALQERAMPVVQGHTIEQVEYCLSRYIDLGVNYIGFGSFGTGGQNSGLNFTTNQSMHLARHVTFIAQQYGISVHFFGLGAPALTAMIYGCGANSFDSSSWIKAAGFGQVFLPFMRAYNVSHRNGLSELQKGITLEQFNEWRQLTRHCCPFCEDISALQSRKMYRTIHNLIVIKDTVELINSGQFNRIQQIYKSGSPKYQKEFDKWLQRQ